MALFPQRLRDLFTRVRYGAVELTNKRYEKLAVEVLKLGQDIQELSNKELKRRSAELKQQMATSQSDHNLAEFFAVVREVAYRTVSMRPYEVQVVAGLALNQAKMVEMQTGEGKTLAAVAPVCWHATAGRGAHVLTFNDYLAKRNAQWMGPIYEFLGFRVGYVTQDMPAEQRRAAYDCDITYVTAKEVGFDYLRDQLCTDVVDQMQRGFHFAIVDEADSILIDEARIPLVIAGEDQEENEGLPHYAELIRQMNQSHFSIQPGMRNVSFRDSGIYWLQQKLCCGDLYEESNVDLLTRLNLALQAEKLLKRDVDYIVRDGRPS